MIRRLQENPSSSGGGGQGGRNHPGGYEETVEEYPSIQ